MASLTETPSDTNATTLDPQHKLLSLFQIYGSKALYALTALGGVSLLFKAIGYGWWVDGGPGPGLWPIISIIALILTGILSSIRVPNGSPLVDIEAYKGPIMTIGLMIVYILTMESLGYIVSTAVVTFVLCKIVSRSSWGTSVSVAIILPLTTYWIFDRFLQVSLMPGIFSF